MKGASTVGHTCTHCRECARLRAGLGFGPYTPGEYARLQAEMGTDVVVMPTPSELSTADDPAVMAAEAAVLDAREMFEKLDDVWREALIAEREARLLVSSGVPGAPEQVPVRLVDGLREALERKDDAWKLVVKRQGEVRAAQHRALLARLETR